EASGETGALRQRHAEFFQALAEEAEPELRGSDEQGRTAATVRWLERLEREHDNLRAAIDGSAESGNVDAALQIGVALGRFWYRQGHWTEGRERLAALLALPGAPQRTEARVEASLAA